MNRRSIVLLVLLPAIVAFAACTQVTNAIDNFFTFNVNKSFDMPFPALSPLDTMITSAFPMALDASTLSANGTSLNLVKSVKLTRLKFTFSDTSYIMKNSIDTIIVNIGNSTLGTQTLATYSKSLDSVMLTNADFANFIKDTTSKFSVSFRLLQDPKTDITAHVDYTLTVTASPL